MEDNVAASSVQKQSEEYNLESTIFRMAREYDAIPSWWSSRRDSFFREYWYQENFLAATVYAISNRNSAFSWELTGNKDDIEQSQQLLQFAEFGEGWQSYTTKITIDLLTQDNGAFAEVIRPAKVKVDGKTLPAFKEYNESNVASWYAWDNKHRISLAGKNYTLYDTPLDLPIGLAHLDAGQCVRTGDSTTPVLYTDRDGKQHALKWWQVLMFNEMPSPIKKMNGVGYSALTRLFRSSHIMQSLSIFDDEKLSGRFTREIHLTNIDARKINDAIQMANEGANNAGVLRYSQPIIAETLNPDATPSLVTIPLASTPDNFNADTKQNTYIGLCALAFGVDYGFLAPLPGKGLGTASQSETQEKQAKGKSSRLFMDMMSNALNFRGILPSSINFQYLEKDSDEENKIEKAKKMRVDRHKIYIETGITTPVVSQQMLSDEGDIDKIYLEQMGQTDATPIETVDGDTNAATIEEQESEVATQETNTNIIEVKNRKAILFAPPSILHRIKRISRIFIKQKQTNLPKTKNEALQLALDRYSLDLEKLVIKANTDQIKKHQFKNQLSQLVVLSLTAIYSEMIDLDIDNFTSQDLENLEEYLAINLESVTKIADDIYNGRYQPTEENEEKPLALLLRLGLWVSNAFAMATLAMVFNPKHKATHYKFILGHTKEHCKDCVRLNGQVHTGDDWSQHSEMLPRSHSLECKGFNCLCYLEETKEPVNGNF